MATVKIDTLPKSVSNDVAVSVAYKDEIQEAAEKLRLGLSVLIECDKLLVPYLFTQLRDLLKEDAKMVPVDGNPKDGTQAGKGYLDTMLANFRREVTNMGAPGGDDKKRIIALPNLDLLTASAGGLPYEAREAIAWLHENPTILLLGFKDPTIVIPKVIENFFAYSTEIVGLKRTVLAKLIAQEEARKFGKDTVNPFQLYKYVSGMNAVRFRQVMREFMGEMDSDGNPATTEARLRSLRAMTASSNFELPNMDMNKDIGGYESVKQILQQEILGMVARRDDLENHDDAEFLERLIPKGVIFWGPPGTGKTLFAKALASELEAAINIVSGPELKSKFVGESESNLRQVFYQARQNAPAVIVFDELDSIAMARGMYTGGSGVEHSMVNQLLTEMDGFRKEELVFVVGTTNFIESIDPALLRPGRFELHVHLDLPNENERLTILQLYNQKYKLDLNAPLLQLITVQSSGSTGDHLEAMCRFLKRWQIREGKPIGEAEVLQAIDSIKKRYASEEKPGGKDQG